MMPAEGIQLQSMNTLAQPGVAEFFCEVCSEQEITEALQFAESRGLAVHVLGGGSNVLVAEKIPGLVIRIALTGIQVEPVTGGVRVTAGAGENWHEFVMAMSRQGHHGLENLALIPGTVGASPVQNIGAYGVEAGEWIGTVRCYDREQQRWRDLTAEQCCFAYRDSLFKQHPGRFIVSQVVFRLTGTFAPVLEYGPLKQLNPDTLSAMDLCDEICRQRSARLPMPETIPNAGSFFKNPLVSEAEYTELKQRYPDLVAFPVAGGLYKLAAGWLIDRAGLKGWRDPQTGAGTHTEQALVLVNPEQRGMKEVLSTAGIIQQTVLEKFAVALEAEPQSL